MKLSSDSSDPRISHLVRDEGTLIEARVHLKYSQSLQIIIGQAAVVAVRFQPMVEVDLI